MIYHVVCFLIGIGAAILFLLPIAAALAAIVGASIAVDIANPQLKVLSRRAMGITAVRWMRNSFAVLLLSGLALTLSFGAYTLGCNVRMHGLVQTLWKDSPKK